MIPSVFISHHSLDKSVARKFGKALASMGIKVWIDEAEIHVGDSLISTISKAIHEIDFVVALISERSVQSSWVKKELSLAMTKEINGKRAVVLPILIDNCEMPFFLSDKLYADISDPNIFDSQVQRVAKAILLHRHNGTEMIEEDSSGMATTIQDQTDGFPIIGSRVILGNGGRPQEAFFGIWASKFTERFGGLFFGFGGLVLLCGLLLFSSAGKGDPVIGLMIISGGILLISGAISVFEAFNYKRAFYKDANLLLEVEKIGGYAYPFSRKWFKQYNLGKRHRGYRRALLWGTFGYILRIIGVTVLCYAAVLMIKRHM